MDSKTTEAIEDGMVELDLHNEHNYGYMGTVYMGSDLQPIRAIFDTGSANSWILSKKAVEDSRHKDDFQPFDESTSETFREMKPHKSAHITFGSGDLEGYFAYDQVTLGHKNALGLGKTLTIDDYNFGLVEEQHVFSGTFDAIIGLAYPKMAERGTTPFFEGLINSGLLHDEQGNPNNVFSFYMSTN